MLFKPPTPKLIQQKFREYHEYKSTITDAELNGLLQIDDPAHESSSPLLVRRYGMEQFTYEGTPYSYVRHFVHTVQPNEQDIIYDLGCGYGKVVLYLALTTPSLIKGIEIVADRVEKAHQIKERLDLGNAEFIRGNVTEQDFTDGTSFFLFNPFSDHAFWWTLDQLCQIAHDHPITIATWGGGLTEKFGAQDWLEPIHVPAFPEDSTDLHRLKMYRSVDK